MQYLPKNGCTLFSLGVVFKILPLYRIIRLAMHIVVCIKQVPDATQVRIDPKTNTLDRSSAPAILNPYDAHAVQEAVNLKRLYGGRVTVLSMGPPQATDIIRKSLELGADEGVLLSDRAFAGSDTLATSYILTCGLEKLRSEEPIDLVICGKQAIDGDTAQVGPGIARRLNLAQLTYVQKVQSVDVSAGEIVVHRRIDQGHEVVKAKLPCVLTVEKEINELSYASLPEMIRAAKYKARVWGIDQLNADKSLMGLSGSPTTVRKIFAPSQRIGGERLSGSDGDKVQTLVSRLLEKIE